MMSLMFFCYVFPPHLLLALTDLGLGNLEYLDPFAHFLFPWFITHH